MKEAVDSVTVSNIEVDMSVSPAKSLFHSVAIPQRRGILAEKRPAHVVIDPDDIQSHVGKGEARLGSNQSRGSAYEGDAHSDLTITDR